MAANMEFAKECLSQHNALRARHNAPELELDPKLSEYAQEWAQVLADKGSLEHRQGTTGYGENLFVGQADPGDLNSVAREAVQSWYGRHEKCKFEEPPRTSEVREAAEFSRVVWKESQRLGVGVATTEDDRMFVVCNYAGPTEAGVDYADPELFARNVEPPAEVLAERLRRKKMEEEEQRQQQQQQTEPRAAEEPVDNPESLSSASRSPMEALESVSSLSSATKSAAGSSSTGRSLELPPPSAAWTSPTSELRLRALPPEELRLWSLWLSSVAERATEEWHAWLLDHIDLLLRLNEYLLKAKCDLDKREPQQRVNFSEIVVAKSVSDVGGSPSSGELALESKLGDIARKSKASLVAPAQEEGFTEHRAPPGFDDYEDDYLYAESLDDETSDEGSGSAASCGGSLGDLEAVRKHLCERIPIPANECEMWQLVENVSRQSRRYQMLHEHWVEVCNEVAARILGTPVLGAHCEAHGEDESEAESEAEAACYSYLGFLRDELGFEPGCESELGGYLDRQGRERITCRRLQLFFNLEDTWTTARSSLPAATTEAPGLS